MSFAESSESLGSHSPAPARNPSPPREVEHLNESISIGKTSFSKHWLFSTLMKLIEVIEKPAKKDESLQKDTTNGGAGDGTTCIKKDEHQSSETATKDKDETDTKNINSSAAESISTSDHHAIDISDELQDELCQLWDMSSDEDVANLLHEFKAVELLTEVCAKSDAPRATEIAIGILGNMACIKDICNSMAEHKPLVTLSLCLLSNSDAPTLVELTRFLNTVLSNEKCQDVWLQAWGEGLEYRDYLIFILKSSVNRDLLTHSATLLDSLLDLSDKLCNEWCNADLLKAIVEALQQLGLSPEEGTCSLLHCMQLMSTQDNGVAAIVDLVEFSTDILIDFLLKICEDEIVNLEGTRAAAVASAISVLDIALMSSPAGYSLLYTSEKCIRCLLKIVYACYKEVVILGTPRSSPSRQQSCGSNLELIGTLKDVLFQIFCNTMSTMNNEEVDVSQSEEKESNNTEQTTPSVLKYMDKDCERVRLQSLLNLVLSHEEQGPGVIDNILAVCEKYDLNRLRSIILDSYETENDNDSNTSTGSPS